ncbi:MAG: diaminopimelate epimerase [Longimicrobiales bacterium]|nr:diaminopimelate epimerase [Longimicrobiales bacterium]
MARWPAPPTLSASFYLGHGLGNDYLVFEEGGDWPASPENVRTVCDRHRGVGSDGIVVLLEPPPSVGGGGGGETKSLSVRLRMFNPDGGEFERSGNGLRVLASYLLRRRPGLEEIVARVAGSAVRMLAHDRAGARYDVSVEMGPAAVGPEAVGMAPHALDGEGGLEGPRGECLEVVPVRVGNPHVVVLCRDESELTEERLATVGPFVAGHPAIAEGANVQLALLETGRSARALIWERGVGRTAASGTSACAVAVGLVARRRMAPGPLSVRMPGGTLSVVVSAEGEVVLRGPVEEIADGRLTRGFLAGLPEPDAGGTDGGAAARSEG